MLSFLQHYFSDWDVHVRHWGLSLYLREGTPLVPLTKGLKGLGHGRWWWSIALWGPRINRAVAAEASSASCSLTIPPLCVERNEQADGLILLAVLVGRPPWAGCTSSPEGCSMQSFFGRNCGPLKYPTLFFHTRRIYVFSQKIRTEEKKVRCENFEVKEKNSKQN